MASGRASRRSEAPRRRRNRSLQGQKLGLDYDPELLYVGARFHDIGLVEGYRSEHERFEIDGANTARAFMASHGLAEEQLITVWESIALHTTPEVPRYKQPEVRLVTRRALA